MIFARQLLLVASVTGIAIFATAAVAADAVKPQSSSGAGCMWLAKRVMLALLRDDIVAANDYQDMYRSFVCPAVRLADSFSCVVLEGPPESAADMREKIDSCWEDPSQLRAAKALSAARRPAKSPPPSKPKPPVEDTPAAASQPAASAKPVPSPAAAPVEKPRSAPSLMNKQPPYVRQ